MDHPYEHAFEVFPLLATHPPLDRGGRHQLRREFSGEWAQLKSRGLVSEEGPLWRLSREGVFLANDAFQEFVPPFDREEAAR